MGKVFCSGFAVTENRCQFFDELGLDQVVLTEQVADPGQGDRSSFVASQRGGSSSYPGVLSREDEFRSTPTIREPPHGGTGDKASNGTVLETGVWIASELVIFDSFGIAPGALLHKERALGPAPFGPKRLPISSGPMPSGGLAVFRIRLLPMSGPSRTSVLQVNSALGNVPRERSVEGIRLTSEKSGTEFSEEVGGRVMFLSMHPEVSAPAKTPRQETAPDSSEPPSSSGQNF